MSFNFAIASEEVSLSPDRHFYRSFGWNIKIHIHTQKKVEYMACLVLNAATFDAPFVFLHTYSVPVVSDLDGNVIITPRSVQEIWSLELGADVSVLEKTEILPRIEKKIPQKVEFFFLLQKLVTFCSQISRAYSGKNDAFLEKMIKGKKSIFFFVKKIKFSPEFFF